LKRLRRKFQRKSIESCANGDLRYFVKKLRMKIANFSIYAQFQSTVMKHANLDISASKVSNAGKENVSITISVRMRTTGVKISTKVARRFINCRSQNMKNLNHLHLQLIHLVLIIHLGHLNLGHLNLLIIHLGGVINLGHLILGHSHLNLGHNQVFYPNQNPIFHWI